MSVQKNHHVARRLSLPPAKICGHKETHANCRPDLSIHKCLAEVAAAPACSDRRTVVARGTAGTDKKQTRFACRCGRLRGSSAKTPLASPTRLLRRVDSGTFQKEFRYS